MGMSHAREDDTYPRLASPLGWVTAGPGRRRRRGRRHHAARLRQPRRPPPRPPQVPRRRARHRVDARRGRAPAGRADRRPGRRSRRGPSTTTTGRATASSALPVPSGKVARPRRRAAAHRRSASSSADGTVTELRVTPRQDLLLHGIAPGRVAEVEQRLRDHGVAARRRRQRAAPPGDRLPGAADVRSGARRGRAGAAGAGRRAGEGAVRRGRRRRADPAQHDRLPERVRPAVQRRDRHRRAGQEELRRLRRRVGVPATDSASASAADVPLDQLAADPGAGVRPLRRERRFGRDGGDAGTFGAWANEIGAATIETWLPEPVVRRRAARDVVIALVGAGPGDPELLTVRAARLARRGRRVVHDALVGDGVLALARPDAELIDVGKRPGPWRCPRS